MFLKAKQRRKVIFVYPVWTLLCGNNQLIDLNCSDGSLQKGGVIILWISERLKKKLCFNKVNSKYVKKFKKIVIFIIFLEAENDYLGVGDDSTRSSFLFAFKFVLFNQTKDIKYR